ncbi:MAG: hypothetical protein D6760_07195 [Deltaproteobacteria bacterium]|nr:MAG: hypothetical protein D6760_07195 [Deltaproteobacteria bacterium]
MTRSEEVRRILVALDASEHSLAALEAAAEMAARLRAELEGLYVEDSDLLRAASLPFARELSAYGGGRREMSGASMERTLRARAARLRRALEAAAERAGVAWSFRTARGRVARELLSAAEQADMLVVGKAGVATTRRVRAGSVARQVVSGARRTVVVLQRGSAIGRPVLVWYDGSEAGRRALRTGARLAESDHRNIGILIPEGAEAKRLAEGARTVLAEEGLPSRAIVVRADLGPVLAAMRDARCRTLVLPAPARLDDGRQASSVLLDYIDCPVVLVP